MINKQAKEATELALKNNIQLMVSNYILNLLTLLFFIFSLLLHKKRNKTYNIILKKFSEFVSNKFLQQEIEFPTAGLDSVPGNLHI